MPSVQPLYTPVSDLTPQGIQQFLLQYSTPERAKNSDYWNSLARTQAGQEFLQQHILNRESAGDYKEADSIKAALALAKDTQASVLPKLPAPPPSRNATSVARAASSPLISPLATGNQQIATNRAGANSLRIPLIKPLPIR